MLDADTKRRIDSLRDILVGIIPNPQTQIDHITTGLIYKFIYDMDQESISMGGKASFFSKDYEKYSWEKLFDSKLGGAELVKLYRDAVESFYLNPSAPVLFRDLFKNATSPTTNSAVLKLFLKEINEFVYSNSETLGNAFEYLLSFMGSQGDAGQFRTPRHIIDFIVDILNPKKDETILDPACGTAGFLISAYKHISKNKLTAAEKKKVTENIHGYDITPEMVRLSKVNMYLHNFVNPTIEEYDTLSSDERWSEYYDVILANPPFMTPKGGIQPHNRFGVESNKAEVLFTDYIVEHLKTDGRAGIVVPEGIVSTNQNAYKNLRRILVNSGLVAVISLPSGIFKPYSGVKTNILIFDKKFFKKITKVLFVKVENDGYELGDQRRAINKNDLPVALEKILNYFAKPEETEISGNMLLVERENILSNRSISIAFQTYIIRDEQHSDFNLVNINDCVEFLKGQSITESRTSPGSIPVVAGGQQPAYMHSISNRVGPVITISASGAYAGFVNYYTQNIFASDCFTIKSISENLNDKFLYYLLKFKQDEIYSFQSGGGQPHVYISNFENFEIPLPSIQIQNQIVARLDRFNNVIDGCKKTINAYKPMIQIDDNFSFVELGEIATVKGGKRLPKGKTFSEEKTLHPYLRVTDFQNCSINLSNLKYIDSKLQEDISNYTISSDDIYISIAGTIGLVGLIPESLSGANLTENAAKITVISNTFDRLFLMYALNSDYVQEQIKALTHIAGVPKLSLEKIRILKVPQIPLDDQKSIVDEINNELKLIEINNKLINIFENKISNEINLIWKN